MVKNSEHEQVSQTEKKSILRLETTPLPLQERNTEINSVDVTTGGCFVHSSPLPRIQSRANLLKALSGHVQMSLNIQTPLPLYAACSNI